MCESGEREDSPCWNHEQSSWVTASPSPPHIHVLRAGLACAFLHRRPRHAADSLATLLMQPYMGSRVTF
jgi:hypothetical protein